VPFYRQRPLGPYIVDFYAPSARLVVEVDGGQHFEDLSQRRDAERTEFLIKLGLLVLRFDNRQVLVETDAVAEEIRRVVASQLGQAG